MSVCNVCYRAKRLGFLFPSLPSAGRRSLAHISPPVGVSLSSVVV